VQWTSLKQNFLLVIRYVGEALYNVCVDIRSLLRERECLVCAELREERNFYRNIVLGIREPAVFARPEMEQKLSDTKVGDWTPVQRGRTLSSKKRVAEEFFARRAQQMNSVPATVEELTAAERLFNESLKGQNNAPVS
jgi:hypothetical protein